MCAWGAQARKQAQAIEASLRLERLSQQAGSSMVTTKSYASMDEEGLESEAVLQRLNIILKARSWRAVEFYGDSSGPGVMSWLADLTL